MHQLVVFLVHDDVVVAEETPEAADVLVKLERSVDRLSLLVDLLLALLRPCGPYTIKLSTDLVTDVDGPAEAASDEAGACEQPDVEQTLRFGDVGDVQWVREVENVSCESSFEDESVGAVKGEVWTVEAAEDGDVEEVGGGTFSFVR